MAKGRNIHRPLEARVRRDGPLAAAIAELAPSLSGIAAGVAIRLLALSGQMSGPLVEHLRWRLANRSNWDDRAAIHVHSQFYDVAGWLREERGPRAWEKAALGDVSGHRLVQARL